MRDCYECGKPVRLRATKFRVRGVGSGVHHYIEHMDGSPMHTEEWQCTAMKPYPKDGANWQKLEAKWNGEIVEP